MSFLKIRDLTYTYRNSGVRAIDHLSLHADVGELVAIVGPNTAGKSTFALLLKGLIRPESGHISMNGAERHQAGPDPRVGILFSNPENQLVTSIVQEDVAFGLEVLGEPSEVIQEKVGDTLEQLGINHLGKRMPHLLSGGEQQMAALAGVLVLDPDILVLDEPTTYLDPDARSAVFESLRDLKRQGKVIFLVTHDMREAAMADRVLVMDQGHVVAEGPPEKIFGQPDLSENLGIFPPFLLKIVLEMRRSGMVVDWPQDARSLAGIIKKMTMGHRTDVQTLPGKIAEEKIREPSLSFEKIRFRYDAGDLRPDPVLSGVDFAVEKGTVALLCGANGSGKSTLLQMSNGLVIPDEGTITVDGQPIDSWRKRRGGIPGRVALLFQNPERQIFSPTVFDDIAFGPKNMGVGAHLIEEKVLRAARWVGLDPEILQRPVHTLSGGQMRRTAVAGVLAMETGILVLDEPTDGLDPGGAREFFSGVRRYCDETETAILIAAHEVPDQISMIDHLGYLEGGRIESSGHPSDVLTGDRGIFPSRFLPEHLLLNTEIAHMGLNLNPGVLDPERILDSLLYLFAR